MLAVFLAQVEERGFPVEGVALDGVEEARVAHEKTFEQALGGSDFPLAGSDHLDVEHDGQVEADKVGHDAAVVILDDLPLVLILAHDHLALAALIATAFSTGKKIRGRRKPRSAAPRDGRRAPCFA